MNDTQLTKPESIKSFLAGAQDLKLTLRKEERYAWLAKKLKETEYHQLRKRDKSIIQEYVQSVTGYSRQQLTRLIGQYKTDKWIGCRLVKRHQFAKKYTRSDIVLLAETDEHHGTLSGALTKKLFERAYTIYEDKAYEQLLRISISHLYNLRQSKTYQTKRRPIEKTKRSAVKIGERRKPNPEGRPGFVRIDTVHQGDEDKRKGVYHINAVDEVTQFEVVCSVEKISESYLIPVLEELLESFPFVILNFHSDNGSEYINKMVANLLNKLHIEQTKSRPRHSNDNGLAETKNGAIVRKQFGYSHIPQKWASRINEFNNQYLTPYINYHRPCYFVEVDYDEKGKQKKTYPYKNVMTPYEKLKSLSNAKQYLKEGVTFEILDKIAMELTDNKAAKQLQEQKKILFSDIASGI